MPRKLVRRPRQSANSNTTMATSQAPCTHKADHGCRLSSLQVCCSCADKRPHRAAYTVYVDGRGLTATPHRWLHYCPSCRPSCEAESNALADEQAVERSVREAREAERLVYRRKVAAQRSVAEHKAAGRPVCAHKVATACQLTALGNCCACADLRPVKDRYDGYVNSVWTVASVTRWSQYCMACRDWCGSMEQAQKSAIRTVTDRDGLMAEDSTVVNGQSTTEDSDDMDGQSTVEKAADTDGQSTTYSERTAVDEKCEDFDVDFDAIVVKAGKRQLSDRQCRSDYQSLEEDQGRLLSIHIATVVQGGRANFWCRSSRPGRTPLTPPQIPVAVVR